MLMEWLRCKFRPDRLLRSRRVEALARSRFAESQLARPILRGAMEWEEASTDVRLQYLRDAEREMQEFENRINKYLPK